MPYLKEGMAMDWKLHCIGFLEANGNVFFHLQYSSKNDLDL